ncbi:L domain-like protein [Rozella allomycis CSF55]|uniref:L domain-like protein n=1 Tax=Rozella allomycis (strain CSF55) TaxID=988480 RepID=A0A4P9YD47_ROZAC|nr:L domain-like protein [Rozella allomycis CSF55]
MSNRRARLEENNQRNKFNDENDQRNKFNDENVDPNKLINFEAYETKKVLSSSDGSSIKEGFSKLSVGLSPGFKNQMKKNKESFQKIEKIFSSPKVEESPDHTQWSVSPIIFKVEPNHQQWSQLFALDLSQNQLNGIDDLDKFCPNLKFLVLNQNSITTLKNLPDKLVSLIARSNELTRVDLPSSLKEIDLMYNEIKERYSNILETLNIGHNKLERMPVLNKRIKKINLRGNFIKELGTERFLELEEFDISFNKVEQINIECYPKLKVLNIYENKFERFYGDQNNLEDLNIGANRLKTLVVSKFVSLKKLKISDQDKFNILGIPNCLNLEEFEASNLEETDLSQNINLRILTLKNSICDLNKIENLESINLSFNSFKNISNLLNSFRKNKLKKIDLRNNPINDGFYPDINSFDHFNELDWKKCDDAFILNLSDKSSVKRLTYRSLLISNFSSSIEFLDGLKINQSEIISSFKTMKKLSIFQKKRNKNKKDLKNFEINSVEMKEMEKESGKESMESREISNATTVMSMAKGVSSTEGASMAKGEISNITTKMSMAKREILQAIENVKDKIIQSTIL